MENWRKYLKETDRESIQYDFQRELLEEGKIWDFIKDKAAAAKEFKDKAYEKYLKLFIETANKIEDKKAPIKEFINKYIPPAAQVAVLGAIGLGLAAAGKGKLAASVVSGNVNVEDIVRELLTLAEENKKKVTEGMAIIAISKILPTEELGHGKDHECPSAECESKIQAKIKAIESGNFEPIQVCQQKPVVTARLQGKEDYVGSPKTGMTEPFYHILNGHHRFLAAQRLGMTEVPVVKVQR